MRFLSTLVASSALCTLPFIAGVNSVALSLESRSLQQSAILASVPRSTPIENRIDFLAVSAGDLSEMLNNNSVTSVELVNAYLAR